MKKSYPSSLKTSGLLLVLMLVISQGMSAQSLIHVELWKNAAGTGGFVNNYPVWIKLGAPLNYTMGGTTDNTGRYMDSIPTITVPTPATFITYSCTGARIVSQITLSPNNTWYGDTLIVSCSSPKPALHAFANATQSTTNPLQFSFFGGYTDSAMPSGRSYTYSWDFGNGQSASGNLNTSHTYANTGTYVACLTVTVVDSLHNLTLFSKTNCVTVVAGSVSSCQSNYRYFHSGSGTFAFMDSSMVGTTPVGGSLSYGWDFGDGNGDTTQSANHTYQTPGTYTVCHWVVVRNAQSNIVCTDTICKIIIYNSSYTCKAAFEPLPAGGNDVHFVNLRSLSSTIKNAAYKWTFGDGTFSSVKTPIHSYNSPGWYSVCLEVYALDSLQDTVCTAIYCDSVLAGIPVQNSPGCNARLYVKYNSLDPFKITFLDSSDVNAVAGREIDRSFLLYGNGGFFQGISAGNSAPRSLTRIFQDTGTFQACIYHTIIDTVTNQVLCRTRDCVTYTISSKFCKSEYIVDTANSYQGNVFIWNTSTPSNNSSIHANSYQWNFGDGNTSNQPFPVHTYANPGMYAVCLTLTSVDSANNICTDTFCDTLGVDSLGNLIYKTTSGFTLNVLDPNAIGLEERTVEEFAVYPNPANEKVTMAWNEVVSGEMKWQITDLKGAVLMRGAEDASNKKEMQLDVSRLKAGVYILSASHKNSPVAHYKLRIN